MTKKIAFITGVSSGLGYDLALDLLQKNWIVIGLSRSSFKNTESLCKFKDFIYIKTDISNLKTLDQIRGLKIDLLVNNAACFSNKAFEQETRMSINKIIDTNVKGTMLVTMEVLQRMSEGGRIVFINSVAGINELENQAIYCASKHALTSFAGVLGKELRPRKIKVTSIHPGGINTTLWSASNPYPVGDVADALDTADIISAINYIVNLPSHVEIKTIKMFPDIEWH